QIDARKRRHLHGVGVVGVARTDVSDAAPDLVGLVEGIGAPDRARIARRVERHVAGGAGTDAVDDAAIEIGIATPYLPLRRNAAGDAGPHALHANGAGGAEGAVGVLSARVVLVDLEQGAGERKIAVQELVLGARLQILVLLGRQLLRAGRRSELLERGIER